MLNNDMINNRPVPAQLPAGSERKAKSIKCRFGTHMKRDLNNIFFAVHKINNIYR